MLALAVLAYRLVCSACQPLVPLVLHALPFKLARPKTKLATCKTLATAPQGGATPATGGEPSSACKKASAAVIEVARSASRAASEAQLTRLLYSQRRAPY